MNISELSTVTTTLATTSTMMTRPPDAALQDMVVWYGSIAGSVICILGFFTSLISIVVFAQPELTGVLFKYYLTESVLNAVSALINVFLVWYNKDWSVARPFRNKIIFLITK